MNHLSPNGNDLREKMAVLPNHENQLFEDEKRDVNEKKQHPHLTSVKSIDHIQANSGNPKDRLNKQSPINMECNSEIASYQIVGKPDCRSEVEDDLVERIGGVGWLSCLREPTVQLSGNIEQILPCLATRLAKIWNRPSRMGAYD